MKAATAEDILRDIVQVLVDDKDDWSAETLDAIAEILNFYDWLDYEDGLPCLSEIRRTATEEERIGK